MSDKKKAAPDIGVSESGAKGNHSQLHSTTTEPGCKDLDILKMCLEDPQRAELLSVISQLSEENLRLIIRFMWHLPEEGFTAAYDAQVKRSGYKALPPKDLEVFLADWEGRPEYE